MSLCVFFCFSTHVTKQHPSNTHDASLTSRQSDTHHASVTSSLPHKPNTTMDISVAVSKKGTPLYGQPDWWGESDADEHNKQLLKDLQQSKITEKQRRSGHHTSTTNNDLTNQNNRTNQSTHSSQNNNSSQNPHSSHNNNSIHSTNSTHNNNSSHSTHAAVAITEGNNASRIVTCAIYHLRVTLYLLSICVCFIRQLWMFLLCLFTSRRRWRRIHKGAVIYRRSGSRFLHRLRCLCRRSGGADG